jgi:hypothetical protein
VLALTSAVRNSRYGWASQHRFCVIFFRVFATILTLLLAIQATPAQQQNDRRTWYQAYADAQKAIQDRNWQKAITDLGVAAQRGAPRPGRNVLFYGDVYRDYNPDYYLGIAYTNLQRFSEADSAFERVKQAQLIAPRDALYAEFTRQAANTKDILQKQAAQVRQSAPTAAAANASDIRLPPNVSQAGANASNAAAAAPPAANAVLPGPNQSPASNAANNAATNAVQGPRPPAPNPKQASVPPRPNPVTRPTTQARNNAAPVVPPPPPATAAVRPIDERTGLLQFFSGDYESAAASLAALTATNGVTTTRSDYPRAHFYLACARAALVLTGKAPRSTLREAAAILALADDRGQYEADKRLISPRIRQELGMQP